MQSLSQVTLVTAASSNHYKTALKWLRNHAGNVRIIFYDIGLSDEEREKVAEFPVEIRSFPFHLYPDWMRLEAQDAGAYAWKPVLLEQVSKEVDNLLLWADAGTLIRRLDIVAAFCVGRVCSTEYSSGFLRDWTHPKAVEALGIEHLLSARMRNAAFVAFDLRVGRVFLSEWSALAQLKEVILPPGANRTNHRHDQSILSALFARHGVSPIHFNGFIQYHQDCDQTSD